MPAKRSAETEYSKRILVMVKRDMTTATPRIIWSHEKPLLEQLFGEGTVEDVDPSTLDEGYSPKVTPEMLVHKPKNGAKQDPIPRPSESNGLGFLFVGDPGGEYQRLADVYGKHPEENVLLVEKIYGRQSGGMLKKLLQAPELEELPEAQLRSLIAEYGFEMEPGTDPLKFAQEQGISLH